MAGSRSRAPRARRSTPAPVPSTPTPPASSSPSTASTSIPAITVPTDALDVVVNKTGQVFARIDGQTELQELGQLTLASFANEAGLAPLGDNLFQETAASGPATVGVPGDVGFANVEQGYLENSNVDPVKEITELISAQRAYEMNSKVIQAADEMAAVVSKNIR